MGTEAVNKHIAEWYEKYGKEAGALIHDIWEHPEIELDTEYAARATAAFAKSHGFEDVELRCAEDFENREVRPNSVIATYGSGKPVIAIVGELDALPDLGQNCVPYREEIKGNGHGCGHCGMAGGSVAAACALRYAMEKENLPGTIKLIEAPAEESCERGQGKGWLAKAGVFDGLDLTLMWHAGGNDMVTFPWKGMAVYDATFYFHGKSAHAAGNPWDGRSALDAAQLMNLGCEFLREHLPGESFVHYSYGETGGAPNIVPAEASVHYMMRSGKSLKVAQNMFERICKIAKGAAMMTETEVEWEINGLLPDFIQNIPLDRFVYEVAQKMPKIEYTEDEKEFARTLYKNFKGEEAPDADALLPSGIFDFDQVPADAYMTTDAAFMSYICPSIHICGYAEVTFAPGHHWVNTACAGTSIGEKGALYGYSILAQTGYELFRNPEKVQEFWDYYHENNIQPLNLDEMGYAK